MIKPHVLYCEDEEDDIFLLRRALKKSDLEVELDIVYDGESCLEYLQKKLPDFIILDLRIPKLSGLEVLEKIKKDNRTRGIPVFILTTSNDEIECTEAYEKQVTSFITKPVTAENMMVFKEYWFNVAKLPHINRESEYV